MDEQAIERTLRELRGRLGTDRCSLTLFRPVGGSRLFAAEAAAFERRDLSIQPRQLAEHFATSRGAERHTDLASSAFDSDRSLASKGYHEVVRAAVRGPRGEVIGIVNAMRRAEGAGAHDDVAAVAAAALRLARDVSAKKEETA